MDQDNNDNNEEELMNPSDELSSADHEHATLLVQSQSDAASLVSSAITSRHDDDDDDRREVLSDIFFFCGSVLYLWIAIRDYQWSSDDDELDESDDDDDENWYMYNLLMVIAPLFFLLDAVVSLGRAVGKARRQRRRHADNSVNQSQSNSTRNDPLWEIAIVTMFGMAAFFDFVSGVIGIVPQQDDETQERQEQFAAMLAVHFYLVNAVLALWGRWNTNESDEIGAAARVLWIKSETLVRGGDFLFLFGSIIDVGISYLPPDYEYDSDSDDDEMTTLWKSVEVWGIVSASLWLIDSLLYLLADLMDHVVDQSETTSLQEELREPLLQQSPRSTSVIIAEEVHEEGLESEQNYAWGDSSTTSSSRALEAGGLVRRHATALKNPC